MSIFGHQANTIKKNLCPWHVIGKNAPLEQRQPPYPKGTSKDQNNISAVWRNANLPELWKMNLAAYLIGFSSLSYSEVFATLMYEFHWFPMVANNIHTTYVVFLLLNKSE